MNDSDKNPLGLYIKLDIDTGRYVVKREGRKIGEIKKSLALWVFIPLHHGVELTDRESSNIDSFIQNIQNTRWS